MDVAPWDRGGVIVVIPLVSIVFQTQTLVLLMGKQRAR